LVIAIAWLAARSIRFQQALHRLAWMVRWPSRRSMRAIQARFDGEHRQRFVLPAADATPGKDLAA
jgi:hypothetical protein